MNTTASEHSNNNLVLYGVLALICLGVIYFIISLVLGALSILGPRDRPRFEDKDWVSLFVNYYVVESPKKNIRRTMVVNGSDLSELKKLFVTKESSDVNGQRRFFIP